MQHSASLGWVVLCALGTPLRGQEPASEQQPVTTPAPAPAKGLQWQLGDAAMKLGGYVKVDLIHDFDAIGSTDSFDPRTIPTDGSDGSNTRVHARSTRLNLDLDRPSSDVPMHFFVEGDFFSSENGFRLRHAYGEMHGVLGGQTWTNFMDAGGMPETLDFESPIGFPQIRQAQVRYTKELANGDSMAFAVEEPASAIIPPGVPGKQEEVLPDLTAHYVWNNSLGHVQLAGFGGMAAFNPTTGSEDTVALWGLNLSTKLDTVGKDNTILQLTYGDGVGRYRGGTTAAPDSSGELEAIETVGIMAAYQHFWSDELRSTATYSWVEGDIPAGAPVTSIEELSYLAANVIYQFADRAWVGLEYLYGTNDLVDGSDGDANRVQISVRYDI